MWRREWRTCQSLEGARHREASPKTKQKGGDLYELVQEDLEASSGVAERRTGGVGVKLDVAGAVSPNASSNLEHSV